MQSNTKEKIKEIVKQYAKLFPLEYKQFLLSNREKRDNTQNDFAEIKDADMLERHLMDLPLNLYTALTLKLNEEEKNWLFASGTDYQKNRSGLAWFMRVFPQFKITKDF